MRTAIPSLSREQIEEQLRGYLGVSQVIWLGKGVFNDETDGHVDNLACFVRPGEVVSRMDRQQTRCPTRDFARCLGAPATTRATPAAAASRCTSCRCRGPLSIGAKEAAGVVSARGHEGAPAGERLAGSYVNFYIANGGIVMPLLDSRTDRAAAAKLRSACSPVARDRRAGARSAAGRRKHSLHHTTSPRREECETQFVTWIADC